MRTYITLGTSGIIDLHEDIAVSLNYAIADIRKPETRQGSFSKTITIPGSKNNDKLFAHYFEIGIDCRFNPNIKTPCVIYVDGLEQISGFLRLMKVKINDQNRMEYECSVIGNISNMFTVLGDTDLSELNLSELNHTYNKTNQKNSWSAPVGSGYVYPMIDYGFGDGITYDVTHFFPAVYVKTYIDKIFEYAGFTYSSSFFNSNLFKRLIIPLNSNILKLADSQITPRLFESTVSSSGTVALPAFVGTYTNYSTTLVNYDSDVSDPSNQFNTTTYRYVNANVGNYNFNASFNYQLNSSVPFSPTGWAMMVKYSGGFYTTIASAPFSDFGGIDTSLRTATLYASNIDLLPGDEVFVGLQIVSNQLGTPNLNIATGGSFKNSVNNIGLFDGDTVNMTLAIPQKVKMKEFFMSIVKMFNLYIETDKDNANKLYIETRDSFYASGRNIDWTDKLDISQDLTIEPMGELDARRYLFSYTDDKDYYNELYKKTWNEPYGTKIIDVQNEFIQGTKENKIIFSPTPLVNNGSNDRTISMIFSTDSAGNITPKQSNIRILYYGGTKVTTNPWTYTGAISGTSTETEYPYAGHLDSVSSPTIDLNFGVPFEVYYNALAYTNNNLYNAYHRKFTEEITDKDSKIITGFFYLTPYDILKLDFRNQFFVDGHYLRLNKISDYNPIKPGLCKCEFIKIKSANSFVQQEIVLAGGYDGGFNNGDPAPQSGAKSKPGVTSSTGLRSMGNYISENASATIVTGYRNFVGQGCKNVSVFNSSGCTVLPGLHGVSLFNSSGVIATENDLVYMNNVKMIRNERYLDVKSGVNGTEYYLNGSLGATGTYTTVDGKTVTVNKGLVTSIV